MVFRSPRPLIRLALAALLSTVAQFTPAAVIDVAQSPLIVASQDSVKANLLFILDDSGSMNFDFLPDHVGAANLCRSSGASQVNSGNFNNSCCIGGNGVTACWIGAAPFGSLRGQPPFLAASFNGLAYDPAVSYKPPVKADGSYWASQTRAATSTWTAVKNDAYNVQNTNSIDLTTQFPDTEWCVDTSYTDCLRNDNYVLPGTVNSKAYTTFHATTGTGTGSVATGAPDKPTVVATQAFGPHYYNILAAEYCNSSGLRDCRTTPGGAYVYAAPLRWCRSDADSRAASPSANACQATRNDTFSHARFPTKFVNAGAYGGSFQRVDIVPNRVSYPKAVSRTDCTTTPGVCTYDEEMTNFANWWTYYHTRMQSMKSSAALAFGAIGINRRVGYMSINNNTGKDFLNLDTFEDRNSPAFTQRTDWFNKLTAAVPDKVTPLRTALSKAGKFYAGQSKSLNGVKVVDPIQYSCQRNFTILSTDGFWNESTNPTKLDGTEIGDQDGSLDRPMYDGNATGNSLADVAAYFFNTDLRTGATGSKACISGSGTNADVCGNSTNVAVTPDEKQVMKTFTLGLGASGYMLFSPTYMTDTSGDFYAVKQGLTPSEGFCSWQSSGSCNWPTPISDTLTTIDDLWHAAVNGGGTYFSASNPTSLYTGLSSAIKAVDGQLGAAAVATTSNPNVSAGDNQVFVSSFKSAEWSGELRNQRLDIDTGSVSSENAGWSASNKIDVASTRSVYMFAPDSANKLKNFSWSSLNSTEQTYFSLASLSTPGRALSQFCAFGPYCLSAANQAAAAGQLLVDFLRGDRSNEGDVTDATKYFRQRTHRLGDIVNSEAVYVSSSLVNYTDKGYDTFKNTAAARHGVVYVGANDGMLHAFRADTGDELWAYVPTAVLPSFYKLADKQYATQHQYTVDGTPVVQDVYTGGAWRSLLIAGMGAGGRSYYALDVTDPTAPKALWEFTDTNLGLTVGKPEIGKLENGTWAVVFASGYNNVSPGDGVGRLYVVDAATGSLIRTISTGVGSAATPSGMAHIRAWVDNSDLNNTMVRVYGGDNLGNLWRFDINNNVGAAGYDAQRIATLKSSTGVSQPVTSRPELGQVGNIAMVFVGTGRYLGQTDLTDASAQTIYGIKDNLNATDIGDPRLTANNFVQQALTVGSCPSGSNACASGQVVRTVAAPNPVNLAINGGWFVDLPQARERVDTDPQLALGTLVVTSNVIESGNVCKVGGSSWVNFLDYRTGAAVASAKNIASVSLGDAIATRPALIRLPNKKVISLFRLSDDHTVSAPTPTPSSSNVTRRLSWRDLQQQ